MQKGLPTGRRVVSDALQVGRRAATDANTVVLEQCKIILRVPQQFAFHFLGKRVRDLIEGQQVREGPRRLLAAASLRFTLCNIRCCFGQAKVVCAEARRVDLRALRVSDSTRG